MRNATTHTTNSLTAFSGHRFHFNGKEKDNEVYGEGNVYDYGFRIYNPRLCKFLSVDPLTKSYPMLTPYQFASNTPIVGVDIDGLELQPINSSMYQMKYYGSITALNATRDKVIQQQVYDVQLVNKNIPPYYKNGNKNGVIVGTGGRDIPTQTINATGMASPIKAEDDNADPTRIKLTKKGNLKEKPNVPAQNFNTKMGAVGLITDAVNGIAGMVEDLANIDEYKDRQAFYKATNWVDTYINNGEISRIGGDALLTGQGRADLINYINDGTLPEAMKGNKESEAYRTLVESVGNAILVTNGVEIQQK